MSWNNNRSQRSYFDWASLLIKVGIGVIVVVVILAVLALNFGNRHTETCYVQSKDRGISITSDGDGNTTIHTNYRIYTKDCGVLTLSDNWFMGRFTSADTYGQILPKHTYKLDVIGW